jgi:hypothetical protein
METLAEKRRREVASTHVGVLESGEEVRTPVLYGYNVQRVTRMRRGPGYDPATFVFEYIEWGAGGVVDTFFIDDRFVEEGLTNHSVPGADCTVAEDPDTYISVSRETVELVLDQISSD